MLITFFINFDIASQESDKKTIHITNSSSKEKQISKDRKEMKVKKILTNTSKKSVIILGNSMLKHINGLEISKRLESDSKVYVST